MKRFFQSNYFMAGTLVVAMLAITALLFAQQKKPDEISCPMMAGMSNGSHDDCPMMKKNGETSNITDHDQMVMKNGEKEMGFSQTATTHHFVLMRDGGAIRVTAN